MKYLKSLITPKLRWLIGLAAVAATIILPDPARAARPNIVVIQTDDQSFGSLRAEFRDPDGKFRKVMPNTLRGIFGSGTEFTNNYAASPLCSPSRAAVLSGQYPHNSGLITNEGETGGWSGWQALPIRDQNVPAILRSAGYRTAHFGKFTNSYFDSTTGSPETSVPPGWSRWFTTSFISGDSRYYGYFVNDDGTVKGPFGKRNYGLNGPGVDRKRRCTTETLVRPALGKNCLHLTDVLTRRVVTEIRRNGRNPEKPFYLHLDYQGPHGDAVAPAGPQPAARHLYSARRTALRRPPSFNEVDISDKPPAITEGLERFGQKESAKMKRSWQRTLESLRTVDDGVGAILETLRSTGLDERTYVFFTSDNGLMFGEHRFTGGKVLPYEEAARVPLAVVGPAVPAGKRVVQATSNLDIPRTAMALAGADLPYRFDGVSLRPLWRGEPSARFQRGVLFSIGAPPDTAPPPEEGSRRFRAIRVGPYKYIEHGNGDTELYDLSTDRWELRNRAGNVDWAPVVAYMSARLQELGSCSGPECREPLPPPPEPLE